MCMPVMKADDSYDDLMPDNKTYSVLYMLIMHENE